MPLPVPAVGVKPVAPDVLRRAADWYGDRDLIVMRDRRMTFAEAVSRCEQTPFPAVPECKGEHAVESCQALLAPFLVCL